MSETRRRVGIREEDIDDTDDEMSIQERRDLQYATNLSIHDIYMAEQGYRQIPHPRMEPTRTRNLSRTQSVKEGFGKFTRREKGPSREEIDPSIYRQQDVYQQKLKNMWNPKKWAKSAKHAIGKFFIYQNIAPNKAQGPYYQCIIDEIERAGVGVERPTPYEIGGSILEDEIEELKEYIDEFKKKLLRMVDGEKLATMPYVYAAMIKAKEQIQEIAPNSCKKYIDVIDERCRKQIISRIHIAAYYLNPAYQYSENIGDQPELISALKDVVNRIEPSSTIASHALAEVKIFREAMHGFSSRLAVKGREKTDLDNLILFNNYISLIHFLVN
ncbi:hAT dimerization domain-containing protein, partial [Quillaja saponaria]